MTDIVLLSLFNNTAPQNVYFMVNYHLFFPQKRIGLPLKAGMENRETEEGNDGNAQNRGGNARNQGANAGN